MPDSGHSSDANLRAALEVYAAYLQRSHVPNGDTFDKLCAEHSALANELRKLHDIVTRAQSLARSASFHRTVREVFGEEAEVRLALDEYDPTALENETTLADSTAVQQSALPAPDRYTLRSEVARGGMGIIYKVRDRELNRTLAMKVMLGAPPASSLSHRMGEGWGEGLRTSRPTSHPLLTRFLEEVQVTAQLDHPGIVAVHELGLDAAGRPYFTMKLVKGRDLNEIFKLARTGEGWRAPADSGRGRSADSHVRAGLERESTSQTAQTIGATRAAADKAVRAPKSSQVQSEGWNLPRAVGALIKACQAVAFAHTKGVIHRDLKPANVMSAASAKCT